MGEDIFNELAKLPDNKLINLINNFHDEFFIYEMNLFENFFENHFLLNVIGNLDDNFNVDHAYFRQVENGTIYSANDPWDLTDDIDDMLDWIVFNIVGEQETVHEIIMKLSE